MGVEFQLALTLFRAGPTILVADIAGYSRMMGEDEAATLRALAECRGLIDPLLARGSAVEGAVGAEQVTIPVGVSADLEAAVAMFNPVITSLCLS